jgi:signal transduction histidine kinase
MDDLTTIVWMPVGQDASLVCGLLDQAAISCTRCCSAGEICATLEAGTLGAAILAEEALDGEAVREIGDALRQQPSWSHLPIVLLTFGRNSTEASLYRLECMRALGNVTLLERPLRKMTLLASVRSALESRQRQFETRDHIRQLQEAQQNLVQANSDLEQFAFAASHDLQEPLRMINVFTQLLVERLDSSDTKAQEFANFIRSGVSRMELLLRDLLLYSRAIHEDREELHPTLNLGDPLEDAMRVMSMELQTANARVSFSPMPTVKGNRTQLSLVFQNLLSNAIKYAKTDVAPCIRIEAESKGGECLVRIRDNGIGFDPKYATRIFELFQRLENGSKPGTGLGLAISRRIIQRHGGRIWAESEKGKGSCFLFTLPLAEATTS